jgi:hypothetical protein
MLLQRALVLHDAIQAAIQTILVRHGEVAVQQHIHRRLREPFLMHKQLAAWIKQAVDREQFQHLRPRHLAALTPKTLLPKSIEPQLLPQSAPSPAITEAARLAHPQRGEHELNDIVSRRSRTLAIREEPTLQAPPAVIAINDLQRALPALDLRRVELTHPPPPGGFALRAACGQSISAPRQGPRFAEMKHLALDHAPTVDAQALAHRVVDVVFAVFVPDTSFEEHAR